MKVVVSDHALATHAVMVDGATGPVELQVYKTGKRGYFAVDGSWLEQCTEDGDVYISSPFDVGCSVQLIDSMDEKSDRQVSGEPNEDLVEKALHQILKDIKEQDHSTLHEMLGFLPEQILKGILPEG